MSISGRLSNVWFLASTIVSYLRPLVVMLVTCLISPLLTCPNQNHEVVFTVFAKGKSDNIYHPY